MLAIAMHGIVFAPGSAGTTQEVFQDATRNHYATFGAISPMVFLGTGHFGPRTLIFDCLRRQAASRPYADYLCLTDEVDAAAAFIRTHPPMRPES